MHTDKILRFAFAQGSGKTIVTNPIVPERGAKTTAEQQPPGLMSESTRPLPYGVTDLLSEAGFPNGRPSVSADNAARFGQMLVAGFGLQRREPSHVFNDHRGYPSVRSKFPIHIYAEHVGKSWWLDPYRHALVQVGEGTASRIVLAGRYTHLPYFYERLRGPLVDLELGVNLRALYVALELFGYEAALRLPDADSVRTMDRLALRPYGEWALPLIVELDAPAPSPPALSTKIELPELDPHGAAILNLVVGANRAVLGARPVPELVAPQGIARAVVNSGRSWAEVFFDRSSGRVPPHMAGMIARRRRMPKTVVAELAAWLSVPPPHPVMREVATEITTTVTLQDVDGFDTGVYRFRNGHLEHVVADPTILQQLQTCYGVQVATDFDNAIRNLSSVCTFSVNVPRLVDRFGPGGWTLAQYCTGWLAQGVCLSGAAHGLFARPTRAFEDLDTQSVLRLPPGELTLLSVLSGTCRFTEPMLDLRV
ncbi:hypothetical protein GCM10012275_35040 [Longimycelium tulufanense]|uniref:Uncharacterized protein n=1 Tax=Longimycelium tulufanense TaxID=907463 RepID=A0A8J3CH90_9PSEU|nr:hypothetical protein [Longimycelium tulufanense]GGM60986.1 hypothetical protein GCM10012275_35040 [Longimycelium tulufanense]